MGELLSIYHQNMPLFLKELIKTAPLLRLKDVGMNCGVEYTSFPFFKNLNRYSRYDHSIGVALIIWHFTHDKAQSIAGLFHDIATPVFAHTIDFMNDDYETQESTEQGTQEIIAGSMEIMKLLTKYGITLDEVVDYHRYPIADNDSPKLSADRLEYTLGNLFNYGFCTLAQIKQFYDDLVAMIVEEKAELVFKHSQIACEFASQTLKNSRVYVCDEDRFAMQYLAKLIKYALEKRILDYSDLYTQEHNVIAKLCQNDLTQQLWQTYCQYQWVVKSENSGEIIRTKKRYIDPMILDIDRVSKSNMDLKTEIEKFLNLSFEYYIEGKA